MLAIYDWFGYVLPIKERYHMIKESGFDGVLLWWSAQLDRGDYLGGPELAREAGLYVENVHAPFQVQNDLWRDDLAGEASLGCYLQGIEDCAMLAVPTMVLHLPDESNPCNALGLDRLKKIAEKAERFNVHVALENLHNLSNLAFALEQVDSGCVGFCYDCAHHFRYYPAEDLLSLYGSRMMALHLHDNDGARNHRLPWDGELNWPAIMEGIAETGYSGATAIEVMCWDYEQLSQHEFLHAAFDRARRLEVLREKAS